MVKRSINLKGTASINKWITLQRNRCEEGSLISRVFFFNRHHLLNSRSYKPPSNPSNYLNCSHSQEIKNNNERQICIKLQGIVKLKRTSYHKNYKTDREN